MIVSWGRIARPHRPHALPPAIVASPSSVKSLKNSFPELPLMQPLLELSRGIAPADVGLRGFHVGCGAKTHEPRFVHTDRERQPGWIVSDDVDGPCGLIEAWNDAVKVDERYLACHRETETHVLAVPGVRASIAVSKQAVFPERVVIRGVLALLSSVNPRSGQMRPVAIKCSSGVARRPARRAARR